MQGRLNELDYSTKIGINKITAYFMTTFHSSKIPDIDEIEKIIQKEFSHDLDLYENGAKILYELKTYCYMLEISPQLKGSKQSYIIRIKR